jgi:ABC-type transport system substrate-binding protein
VGAPGNTSRYRSAKVDALLDEADAMPAGAPRDRRYAAAEQAILDDAVWVPLYHYTSRALIKPHVRGLERSPLSTAPEISVPLRHVWLDR